MKPRIFAALAALGLFAGTAQAIGINDPGVIGTCALNGNTGPSNATEELAILNQLLSMGGSSTITIPSPGGLIYTTSSTNYVGTATGGAQGTAGDNTVDAGSQYVLAKYDGQNAGYVGWFLGGAAKTLPVDSTGLWTNTAGNGYAISHFTVFNATTVPDGGATVALLGLVLLGLAAAKQFIRTA